MSEQGGYLQEQDLIEECAQELTWYDLLEHDSAEWLESIGIKKGNLYVEDDDIDRIKLLMVVLSRRGLLNDLGISELRKSGIRPL